MRNAIHTAKKSLPTPIRLAVCTLLLSATCFACNSLPWPGLLPQPAEINPNNPLRRIALLPLANDSENVAAAEMSRALIARRLQLKGYVVLPIKETDQLLSDRLGVSIGAQLQEIEPDDLSRAIKNADGFLLGHIKLFRNITLGVSEQNEICYELTLIDAADGALVWQKELGAGRVIGFETQIDEKASACARWLPLHDWYERFLNQSFSESAAYETPELAVMLSLINFGVSLANNFIANLFGTELIQIASVLLNEMMHSLPAGPGP